MVAWAEATPVEGTVRRSVTAASSASPGDWIVPLLRRSAWIAATVVSAAKELQNLPRGDGRRGIPWTLVYSLDEPRQSMVVWPAPAVSGAPARTEPFFSHEIWRRAADQSLGLLKGDDFDFLGGIESRYFVQRPVRNDLAGYFAAVLDGARLGSMFDWEELPWQVSVRAAAGSEVPSLPGSSQFRKEGVLSDQWLAVAAEAHAGALVSPAHDNRIGALLALLRVENQWLYHFFDRIGAFAEDKTFPGYPGLEGFSGARGCEEGQANDDTSPERHALMLTFGLVQYQTTWQWPASPHWPTWFTSSPPEHWLPAHVWHIIRSIQDPTNESHREAADACLDRSDSPTMAEALRKHVLTPTRPEVLALFDRGEADPDDT